MTYALSLVIRAQYLFTYHDTYTKYLYFLQHTRNALRHKPYHHLSQHTPNVSPLTAIHSLSQLIAIYTYKPQRIAPYHQLTATYCDTQLTYRTLSQRTPKTQQPIATYIQYTATYHDMCSIYSNLSRYALHAHPPYNNISQYPIYHPLSRYTPNLTQLTQIHPPSITAYCNVHPTYHDLSQLKPNLSQLTAMHTSNTAPYRSVFLTYRDIGP